MDFDIDKLRELAELASEKGLAEVTVQDGDQSITIKLPSAEGVASGQQVIYTPPPAPMAALPPASGAAAQVATDAPAASGSDDSQYHQLTSPMVGTFYASPSPDAPAFVKVGDSVSSGQTVCIIEAMKMMNELESDVSGKIVKILVENGQPVEFGQAIALIDTN